MRKKSIIFNKRIKQWKISFIKDITPQEFNKVILFLKGEDYLKTRGKEYPSQFTLSFIIRIIMK